MPVRLFSAAADLALVLLFAALGRRNHAEGLDLTGVLDTAWPFLGATAAAHLMLSLGSGPRGPSVPAGAIVWVVTVAGGMALRRATGEGTDPAFVLVASLVLGVLLLGWRVVARIWGRASTPPAAG